MTSRRGGEWEDRGEGRREGRQRDDMWRGGMRDDV